MRRAIAKKSRGFTLMHMLIAMPLLVVFLFLGTKLFIVNNALFQQTDRDGEQMDRIDRAVYQLRKDTWLSTDTTQKQGELILTQPDAEIIWRIADEGALSRSISHKPALDKQYEGVAAESLVAEPMGVVIELSGERYLCPANRPMQGGTP